MKLAHKHSKENLEYAQYIIQLNVEVVKSELKELTEINFPKQRKGNAGQADNQA